jgi:hypothetical protein
MPTLTPEALMSESPLLFGRLPGHIPAGLEDLLFYIAGRVPKAPASVAVPTVADWQMLGNDQYGDCGVAGLQHLFMADAADTATSESFPSEADLVSYYLQYTGGQDSGVVLADYLAHVHQAGYFGHEVAAYAPVKVHDIPTLQFAVWAYDAAYCGIAVTQQMQADFQAGQPWTLESLESPVVGGHCIPIVGYDSQYLYAVTWGQVQPIAYSAWHYLSEEAWAVITGELAKGDGHGVSIKALQADLKHLNGVHL